MSELVTVQIGSVFRNMGQAVRGFRDVLLTESASIMKHEEQSSIRQRWYDTGTTLRSLEDKVITEGDKKTYQLFPTATSPKGAPYPLFGEYGTGQQGSATGRPAPAGYTYGPKFGMRARRFSRIAVTTARPQIERKSQELLRRLARNMTA